jgi:hypothetical protein
MDKKDAVRIQSASVPSLRQWYQRYLTGWTSDYLTFRATPAQFALGRPVAAQDCGTLAQMIGPAQ